MRVEQTDVLVVGGGPAGLAAAVALRRQGVPQVTVVDREAEAGGIPRFCHHPGFGLLDRRRVYAGPAYARCYREDAAAAGVRLLTSTTVTDWATSSCVSITSPEGLGQIEARAVLLATGCRERPRSARLVPGSRPNGIFTTGSLQRFVYEHDLPVGRRAVIIGAELVSLSALTTLLDAGVEPVAMVTELPRHQIYLPFLPAKWYYANLRTRTPIHTASRLTAIHGRGRVEGVELTDLANGERQLISCDTIIFTADWIPEHELARRGKIGVDPGTLGPQVDSAYRTSVSGVFAAGNLLRGAETADASAIEGRRAAEQIGRYLARPEWPSERVPITVAAPLAWLYPNCIAPDELALGVPFYFRVGQFCRSATVTLLQGQRPLYAQTFRSLGPGKSYRLRGDWRSAVQPTAGPVRVELSAARRS